MLPIVTGKKVRRLKTAEELKESTDKINAQIDKAKSELSEIEKKQLQPTSAPTPNSKGEGEVTPNVENKKAYIERRRKLTTITPDGNPQGFESEGIWYFEYIDPDGYRSQYNGTDKQKVLEKINAKYDAELQALESTQPTDVSTQPQSINTELS